MVRLAKILPFWAGMLTSTLLYIADGSAVVKGRAYVNYQRKGISARLCGGYELPNLWT